MSRSWFAPEVIQTSGLDCGPASLKALLGGYGIHAGYGALREAANTDVDGTSIDTLEDLAVGFGLDAGQVVVPPEQVLLPEGQNLPCIAVVQLPSGALHFVVVWRRFGPWVQVMDPGVGRRWKTERQLIDTLYQHEMQIPLEMWAAHSESTEFLRPLTREIRNLGLSHAVTSALLSKARERAMGLADLDAAVRFVSALRRAVRLPAADTRAMLDRILGAPQLLPDSFFSARETEPGEVRLRGAVLLRVRGKSAQGMRLPPSRARADVVTLAPLRELLLQDGLGKPALAACLAAVSAALSVLQALVFRALVDLTGDFATMRHRLAGMVTIACMVIVHALLDRAFAVTLASMGRRLEIRLRVALHKKIPKLADVYFRTRMVADLAERAHAIPLVAELPLLAGRALRFACELGLVVVAIGMLDPLLTPVAALGAALLVATPLLAGPALAERDRVVREHVSALARWFLDALRGVWAVRAHAADGALQVEHERGLVGWISAVRRSVSTQVSAEILSAGLGVAVAAAVLSLHTARNGWTGAALLLVWWSLQLPALGERLAAAWRQLPEARNVALRLLEPLSGPEAEEGGQPLAPGVAGVRVELRDVGVRLSGRAVLEGVDLVVESGQHIAIVGRSGGGKSLLVATLLGLQESSGEIRIDGQPLHPASLREVTRWIDPAIHLWNAPLLDNIRYAGGQRSLDEVLEESDLLDLIGTLPEGLQTAIGDGGGRLSGGEAQRVRVARGLLQSGVRLVVLDEAFRGLDRAHRRRMLDRVRARSEGATLLCVTHDLEHAMTFDRVAVVEEGRVVEEGAPAALAAREEGRFRALLSAEERVLARQRAAFGGTRFGGSGLERA